MPTLDPINAPVNVEFPDAPNLEERRVSAIERQAVAMIEQATAMTRNATAAEAIASAAGTSGNAWQDLFERQLGNVLRSPRNFGTADDSVDGILAFARNLALGVLREGANPPT